MHSLRDKAFVEEDDSVLIKKLCLEPWTEILYQVDEDVDLTTRRSGFVATFSLFIRASEDYILYSRDHALCGLIDVGVISTKRLEENEIQSLWAPIWPSRSNVHKRSNLVSFASPPRKPEILHFIHQAENLESGERYFVSADEGLVIHSSTGQRFCIITSERDVTAVTFSFSSDAIDRVLIEENASTREL